MEQGPSVWAKAQVWGVRSAYAAVVALFILTLVRLYEPNVGFSYLVTFGAKQNLPQLSEFKHLNYFLQNDGAGYDAQYYAQIAMHPSLREPELKRAIDSLPYRARRILIGWSSYVMGLGQPAWILEAYALQNVIAWVALAVLLLRWLPPVSWTNVLRWGGVLFGAGMCLSLRHALIDGPSLLLTAIAVWCVECNRPWLATAVLALSGLGKETNLLAGTALADPSERSWRSVRTLGLRAVLIGVPLAAWLIYIHLVVGPAIDLGVRNFNWPLLSYVTRWRHTVAGLIHWSGWQLDTAIASLLMLIALTTQALFFLLRPRPREIWWRVGVCFALLMIVLGTAVWEGYPGAAARVLLPMQLAFNLAVPRLRRWWIVLILGNLTLFNAADFLEPTAGYGYRVHGPTEWQTSEDGREKLRIKFDRVWFEAERRGSRYWRWSRGDASFTITNPRHAPVHATLTFYLDALDDQSAKVISGDRVLWSTPAGGREARVELKALELPPGDTTIRIESSEPKKTAANTEARPLAFALRDFEIHVGP